MMKSLGLNQPFASLIRRGIKTIETRFWKTSYRGTILICSTRTLWPKSRELLSSYRQIDDDMLNKILLDVGTMQCLVDIVDCRPGLDVDKTSACCELFAPNKHGIITQKYALVLDNIRPVVRKPLRCGRKWFNVDDALIEVE